MKVNYELKCDNEITEWLSSSWAEIVGSGRETNYMKPHCSARFDKSRREPVRSYLTPTHEPLYGI